MSNEFCTSSTQSKPTVADVQLRATREHIHAAINTLACLVINECPGSEKRTLHTRDFHQEVLAELLKLRARLS